MERITLPLDEPTYERPERIELGSGTPHVVALGSTAEGLVPELLRFDDCILRRSLDGRFAEEPTGLYRLTPTSVTPHCAEVGSQGNDVEHVAGTSLVLGAHQPVFNNFGHFLSDQFPILFFEDQLTALECRRVVVLAVRPEPLKVRIRELLGRFSSLDLEVEFLEPNTSVFETALVPQNLSHHPKSKTVALERLIRRTLDASPQGDGTAPSRLFVSRSDANDRFLINEAELDSYLEGLGYQTVQGSRLTLDQSIDLFRRAEAVVGVIGAAVANMVFCRPGTPVLSLAPEGMDGFWYYDLASLFGLRPYDLHAPAVEAPSDNRPRTQTDFVVDMEVFAAAHRSVM